MKTQFVAQQHFTGQFKARTAKAYSRRCKLSHGPWMFSTWMDMHPCILRFDLILILRPYSVV